MRHTSLLVCFGIVLTAGVARGQQEDFSKVTIKTTKLAEGMYMLEGAGGNIGVSVGDDGVILVDDQFAPLTPKIQEAISKITPRPVRFVINTHWHGDHVGGNENLATAGAVIVAHDNVRKRMSTEQFIQLMNRKVPPSPPNVRRRRVISGRCTTCSSQTRTRCRVRICRLTQSLRVSI